MSLIQFNGKITTVSPVSISTPGVNGLLRDSRGNPMISGSSIRGWLRHSGHQALTHLKADEQQFFTVDEHYMLASGVDTARVVQDDESICVSHNTHNAIHFGDISLLPQPLVERAPNDTIPWR